MRVNGAYQHLKDQGYEAIIKLEGVSPIEVAQHVDKYSENCNAIAVMVTKQGTEIWGKKEPQHQYKENIISLIDKQIAKGESKYGQTLEDNTDLTHNERLQHIAEELVDGLQYIEHLRAGRKQELQALIEVITKLQLLAGKRQDDDLLQLAKSLNLIAKAMA